MCLGTRKRVLKVVQDAVGLLGRDGVKEHLVEVSDVVLVVAFDHPALLDCVRAIARPC